MKTTTTNYTTSTVIGNQAPEVKIIFCHLNDPKPSTDPYHAGEYGVNILIPKNSLALKEVVAAYKDAMAHAKLSGIDIPKSNSSSFFLKDGDAYNEKRVANGKEPIESYKGCYYFEINTKFQPVLYDNNAQFAFATDSVGRQIVVNNRPRYYLSNLEGSLVTISLKFNVGRAPTGTFAKPYIDWLMQVKPGVSSGPSISPSIPTWGGATNGTSAPTTSAPVPTPTTGQAKGTMASVAPTAPNTQISASTDDDTFGFGDTDTDGINFPLEI